jgi:uncharacterized protein YdaU (DUF1376 family)
MAELPYMAVSVADAIADAEGLTNEQLGALERVRRVLWRTVTASTVAPTMTMAELRAVSRLGKRWGKAGPGVLARLLVDEATGRVSCPVINERLALTRKRRRQRVTAAQASVTARQIATTEGSRNYASEGARKPRNPLKTHRLDADLVGPSSQRAASNQNHNIIQNTDTAPAAVKLSGEEARVQQDALYGHGVALLMARTRVTRLQAQKTISAWLGMMGGDADATAALLARAEAENLTGQHFSVTVARWAKAAEDERTKGLALPLPLVGLKRAGGPQR